MTTAGKLVRARGVAEALSVSERTVYRLMRRGLPCVRVGKALRFDLAAVREWLAVRQESAK